ncbi:MAG: DUF4388 domain-containing protein, partial [Smithella sp.]
MSMQGNLQDVTIADLIQLNCLDRKTEILEVQHAGQLASLYFKEGNVIHATHDDLAGEEVVYQILKWEDGSFIIEYGFESPVISITRSWSGLLLEGARRLDESELNTGALEIEQNIQPEVKKMTQNFNEILTELAGEVIGYSGSALVGMDGLEVASNTRGIMDPEAVSAQMATLLKLVDGSMDKLSAGTLEDNLMTTENAYI